jgi:Domain of unknown function (DUF4277)
MPTVMTARQRARLGVLRSTPSRDRPPQSKNTAAKLTRGHRRGKPPVLEQALTGLVQDGHPQLPVIQSARIDVLDAQIEPTFRTSSGLLESFRGVGRLSSLEEPTMPPPYRRQILDHLGLVAVMCDALGIGAVIDQATQPHPEARIVTVGHAVKAMVLRGLGVVNQQRSLVPLFFQNKPTHRLMAPGIEAQPLHDDTRGRALYALRLWRDSTLQPDGGHRRRTLGMHADLCTSGPHEFPRRGPRQ